ncbi:MAG: gamma-butyrobetaine hydroxylase-like domain-containing protein [Terriglobia bacterium]
MAIIPRRIKLDAGNDTLRIEWSDGHISLYAYRELRDKCPCATCTDAHAAPKKTAPAGLPVFTKTLRPERAELVGRYALQIFWNDGHSTGIYGFSYLRELCPCDECEAARREA